MAQKGFITLHIVNDIPYSNLNRDDSGTPKRTILGGVERSLLSSQAIKRAIRKDYEKRILEEIPNNKALQEADQTLRTRNAAQWVIRRGRVIASEMGVDFNEKSAERYVKGLMKKLTGGEDTPVLLSVEELEAMAQQAVAGAVGTDDKDKSDLDAVMAGKRTGSLAIAAFGRMFANSFDKVTDAAIAVSPAIATHGSLIEADYFITSEDFSIKDEGAGAAHLGTRLYTSAVTYRSVTIDVQDLKRNWTGWSNEEINRVSLRQLIESIIRSLPTGMKNHTAPYVVPQLVIAEVQDYREAYSIETPVKATKDGGFLLPTLQSFKSKFDHSKSVTDNIEDALIFEGHDFGPLWERSVPLNELINKVADGILRLGGPVKESKVEEEPAVEVIEVLEEIPVTETQTEE